MQISRALRALVDDHMDELIESEDNEASRSSEETDALEVSSPFHAIHLPLSLVLSAFTVTFLTCIIDNCFLMSGSKTGD